MKQKYAKFKELICTVQSLINCEGYNKFFWRANAIKSQYFISLLELQDSSNLALQDSERRLAEHHADDGCYLKASISYV